MKEEIKIKDSGIWAIIFMLALIFSGIDIGLDQIAQAINHLTLICK
jgi:hypothetical protein